MKKDKDGKQKIECPFQDRPGIKETAKTNYNAWILKMKKRRNDRKRRGCGDNLEFKNLSTKNQEKIHKAVLASYAVEELSVASSVTTPTLQSGT